MEQAPRDSWLAYDKLKHFVISCHLTTLVYQVSHRSYYNNSSTAALQGVGLVFTLGIGKELTDRRKPKGRFSLKDLTADALGIGVGLILGHNLK